MDNTEIENKIIGKDDFFLKVFKTAGYYKVTKTGIFYLFYPLLNQ